MINCIRCRPVVQHEAPRRFTGILHQQRNGRTQESFWTLRRTGLRWPQSVMPVLLPVSFPPLVLCSQVCWFFFFFRLLIHIHIAYNQSPRPCLSLSPNFQALTLHLLLFLFPHPSHFSYVLLPLPMNLLLLLSLTSIS